MERKLTDPFIAKHISTFQNLPKNALAFTPKPVPKIDSTLSHLLEKLKIEEPKLDHIIMKNWQKIMGSQFAHRSSPEKITSEGTLLIRVGSSTLKSELKFQKKGILTKLRKRLLQQFSTKSHVNL